MQKVFAVILFLISAVFSIKAVNATAADSLEISYDCIYAVDWNVDIYPVANICTFPQESVDKVVDAMQLVLDANDKKLGCHQSKINAQAVLDLIAEGKL